jgi:hypothetical protein
MADVVNPLNPRDDPTVALAVQVLRAGGARGDALRVLMDFDEPPPVIATLAAVATFIGGRYYGSTGAFMEALEVWQRTGELPEPSTPNYLPRLFRDLPDIDDLSGRHRARR